jgi:hypothetical protein
LEEKPPQGSVMEQSQLLFVVFAITSVLAAGIMFAMFRGKPFDRFEMSRLYFAAGTLAVLSFVFLVSMILYALGPDGASEDSPGKVIFEACVKVIPPIVTLIIGFYFGAQQRSHDGDGSTGKSGGAAVGGPH